MDEITKHDLGEIIADAVINAIVRLDQTRQDAFDVAKEAADEYLKSYPGRATEEEVVDIIRRITD